MGPLRIFILVLGCRRSSISTHKSVKAVVAREQSRCMQRRRHTRSGRPTHRHTTHNGRLSRTIGLRTHRKHLAAQMGGGIIPHTPEQRRHLVHVSARSMWPALSPLLSPFQRRRAATRHAEPVLAGDLGAARDAGMRDGSVGSVPKADRLGCELRQPPFLYLDHVQAVGGRAGWPRAGGGEGVRR